VYGPPTAIDGIRACLLDELERLDDFREVARAGMAVPAIDERRLLLGADRLRLPAAGAESAA
jgi:hypothetical protein